MVSAGTDGRPSSGRPLQAAATEHVGVHVVHGLAGVRAGVEHDPVPAVGHPLVRRDLVRQRGQLLELAAAGRRDRGQVAGPVRAAVIPGLVGRNPTNIRFYVGKCPVRD